MGVLTTAVLLIAIATFVVGLSTFLLNPKHYQNITFFLMASSLSAWVVANFVGGNSDISGVTELFYLMDYVLGLLLAFFLMLFCRNLFTRSLNKPRIENKHLAIISSLVLAIVVAVGLNLVVTVELVDGESVQTEEALFYVHALATGIFLIASIWYLVVGYIKVSGLAKQQISIVLIGIVFLIGFGATPNLILPSFLEEDSDTLTVLENLTYLGIFILTASSSYAIIKHRLFDPRLALIRLLGYVLSFSSFILLVTLSAIALAAALLNFDVQAVDVFIYAMIVASTLILFPYIRKFFDDFTTKIFYQDKYDGMSIRVKLLKLYTTNVKLSVIMNKTLEEITSALKPVHFHIVVFNAENKAIFVHKGKGSNQGIERDFSKALKDDEEYILTDQGLQESRARKLLSSNNIDLLMRLNDDNKSTGYLLLGPKSNGSVYYDEDIYFLSAVVRNFSLAVSNSKKFEQLEGFNVTLQEEVDRATKKLKRSNERLREHDIAKNEFMSMTSHQLKPQLTAVQNFAAMLEDDKGLKDEQLDLVRLCRRGVERSLSIITGILDLPKFDTMDLRLNKTEVDLVSLVKSEVKRFDSILDKRNIEILVKTPRSLKSEVDNTKIAEAFSNIVRNAIYYSPDGTKVKVVLSKTKKCAVFEVQDSGQGVPVSERKKLFTKFYRSAKAKKTQPSGTGIGLFFLKKVAEAHDGEAFYKPGKSDKGSIFGFKIPI